MKKKTLALIEKDSSGYGIFTPDLKSTLIGEGKTVAEAKADFMNSFQEAVAMYAEEGKELPEELKDIEFEFKYDVSALFNECAFINVSQFAKEIGVSPSLMRHYKTGDTYISTTQARKIQDGLHGLAARLSAIKLV